MRLANRLATLSLFAVLTAVAALTGCKDQNAASAPAPQAPPPPEVGIVTIAPKCATITTELAGRTSPHLIAEVRPQVGGIIQKRLFEEGADIKAGQPLYKIDPSLYQAAVDSAKASLAKAEANTAPLKLKAERYRDLVNTGAISKQEYDDADAAYKQAVAAIAVDKAALATASINLAYTSITSPIAGRIGKSEVTPGALVTASQAAPLATVQQLDPIYVDVTQSSMELLRLRRSLESGGMTGVAGAGAKVRLVLEDGTPYAQEGRLEFSDVTVDQSTGVVTLRAVFPNPDTVLLPGMYVRAVLEEGVCDNAILVPQPAVVRDAKGGTMVYVVGEGDVVQPRPVVVDRALGGDWLVSKGLGQGDRVVLEGLQKIRPGMPVRVAQAASGSAQ